MAKNWVMGLETGLSPLDFLFVIFEPFCGNSKQVKGRGSILLRALRLWWDRWVTGGGFKNFIVFKNTIGISVLINCKTGLIFCS